MKILMDNLTRKVSELRKRVEESRRRLCAKKDEMNQLDLDVEKKEKEVKRLHSAMASVGGRGQSPSTPLLMSHPNRGFLAPK